MADILVVENNRSIVDLLEEILVSGGHQVSTAQSGVQASQMFKKHVYDVAFIDLGLPDIDGLTLIRNLKTNNNPTIPVVISGRSDFCSAVEAFRAGARDYILKPFDIDDILRVASEIPEEKKAANNQEFNIKQTNNSTWSKLVQVFFSQIYDPVLAAITFFFSLIIQNLILPYQNPITIFSLRSYLFLSICLGFSWGFMAWYFQDTVQSSLLNQLKHYSWRLGLSYLLFGTILFFVFPMADCRPAILIGYILGLVFLISSRQYLIPGLLAMLISKKEGKRRIIIVGNGPRAEKMLDNLRKQFGDRQIDKIIPGEPILEKKPKNRLSDGDAELYLDAGLLGHEEINHLITDFGGQRVIINMPENKSENPKQLARV